MNNEQRKRAKRQGGELLSAAMAALKAAEQKQVEQEDLTLRYIAHLHAAERERDEALSALNQADRRAEAAELSAARPSREEQAVLDACAELPEHCLTYSPMGTWRDIARAEIARREAAK
jgi:hypothetical protein